MPPSDTMQCKDVGRADLDNLLYHRYIGLPLSPGPVARVRLPVPLLSAALILDGQLSLQITRQEKAPALTGSSGGELSRILFPIFYVGRNMADRTNRLTGQNHRQLQAFSVWFEKHQPLRPG